MRSWTADQVAELDDVDARYSPALTRVETPEYLLFVVPDSSAFTCVRRFQADSETTDSTIDEVLHRVRSLRGTGMRWVINSRTRPVDIASRLLRRGFALSAAAEILYHDLGTKTDPSLPSAVAAGGIAVREASTREEVEAFVRLGGQIFHEPPPPVEFVEELKSQTHEAVEATGHSPLFLVLQGTVPIGRGGLTVTGNVGRLWTSGVLAQHRGKGAYQLLTRERCRVALERGAELAITHAVVDTSGRILKRHGFRSAGPYDYYRIQWD